MFQVRRMILTASACFFVATSGCQDIARPERAPAVSVTNATPALSEAVDDHRIVEIEIHVDGASKRPVSTKSSTQPVVVLKKPL